ncbi:MAG: 4'-phosphopantetheinyl transferase superfamily protein [Firmicutes bacterium]|nr:4'-phosphopantetheinyl transferase superfamily protein [Bacillota bacterium]
MYDLEECMKLRSSAAIRHHLISRIALKNAVCAFVREKNNDILLPKDFFCTHDERGCPLIKSCGYMTRRTDNLHVSLSHKDYRAAAIVSDIPVGIDLEKIEQKSEEFIRIAYTEQERARLRFLDTQDAVIRFWVAKEACAKKTGLGLQGQPQAFEVIAIDGDVLTIGETRVKTLKVEKDYIVGWTI